MKFFEDLLDVAGYLMGDQGIYIPPKRRPPIIYKPKKPRIVLDINVNRSIAFRGLVLHHAASPDRPFIDEWPGITHYHKSYAIDGHIVSKAVWEQRKSDGDGKYFKKAWSDVGYHGGIEFSDQDKDGESELRFHWGRPLYRTGAHAAVSGVSYRFNKTHFGLCVVGDFDKNVPSPELWDFTLGVTRTIMDTYDFNTPKVIGHREVYDILGVPRQKTCPGTNWDMDKFRAAL